jgi:hypothetical protein
MGTAFWLRRFAWVFAIAFVVIAASQFLLRGRTLGDAALQGAIWAAIAATLFTATRLFKSRRGEACALCGDTPGLQ